MLKTQYCLIIFLTLILAACKNEQPVKSTAITEYTISDFSLAKDGRYALVAELDKGAKLWDLEEKKLLHKWSHSSKTHNLNTVKLCVNGKKAITIDRKDIGIWDTNSGSSLGFWAMPSKIVAIALTETGEYALIGLADQTAIFVNLNTGEQLRNFKTTANITSLDLSLNGSYAILGCADGSLQLWNINSGKKVYHWHFNKRIKYVKLSPDNSLAFCCAAYLPLKIIDLNIGKEIISLYRVKYKYPLLQSLSQPLINVTSAIFSKDGKLLLTGAPPRNLYLWNLEEQQLVKTWILPKVPNIWKPTASIIHDVVFSNDEQTAITASSEGIAYIWNIN